MPARSKGRKRGAIDGSLCGVPKVRCAGRCAHRVRAGRAALSTAHFVAFRKCGALAGACAKQWRRRTAHDWSGAARLSPRPRVPRWQPSKASSRRKHVARNGWLASRLADAAGAPRWMPSQSSRAGIGCSAMAQWRVVLRPSAVAEWRVVLRTVAAVGGGWRGSRRPIVAGRTTHLCERWIELRELISTTGKSGRG